ncbi:hypothetical protein HPB50_018586 [Hyalomma asiaticum]|uniref:Uncharacterized protein n=1 Tax=Hyalomma asiaticum TaxID=266040 RepID=A0ACB7T8X4_HYAAI|nr:hypothetical protein HPB50_018586 [Hyalomma asiaticum]
MGGPLVCSSDEVQTWLTPRVESAAWIHELMAAWPQTTTLETNVKGRKHTFTQEIDGDLYNIHFDPNRIREALAFKPRPGDVIQMSYASSGTRWIQQIIQLIVYKGYSATSFDEFWERLVLLEHSGKQADAFASTPRLIMTHIRPGKLADVPEAKYVYVARNPWDVCCSLYDYVVKVVERADRVPFEDYLSLFLDGRVATGRYFEHVNAGYLRRNEPNFFFVTYEEMQKDCGNVLLRLADFLDGDYGESLRRDPKLLRELIEKCSAPYMSSLFGIPKETFTELLFRNPNISRHTASRRTEDMEDTVAIVRRAKIGSWKVAFSKVALKLTLEKINSDPQGEFVRELWKDIYDEVLSFSQ